MWVIDATKVLELNDFSPGTRIYLRAQPLHPGAKANLFDTDGNRVTALLTKSPRFNVAFLNARHRARGRCENSVKTLKNAGLGKPPYWSFAANQAWADMAMFAPNFVSWLQLAALPRGHEASVWDLRQWRYPLFSMAVSAAFCFLRKRQKQACSASFGKVLVCCSSGDGTASLLPEMVVSLFLCFSGFERSL